MENDTLKTLRSWRHLTRTEWSRDAALKMLAAGGWLLYAVPDALLWSTHQVDTEYSLAKTSHTVPSGEATISIQTNSTYSKEYNTTMPDVLL